MNDQATPIETKKAQYPHEFISEMVDVAVARFQGKPLTPELVAGFFQENPQGWIWAFNSVGIRKGTRFFAQLYDQRKARYEAG